MFSLYTAGDVSTQITQATTHIVSPEFGIAVEDLKKRAPFAVCVTPEWALECIAQKKLLDETIYFLHPSPAT